MFDFHLHICRFEAPSQVASQLKTAGVSYNNVACEPWEWEKSLELGETCAFGIHPMIASQVTQKDWKRLEEIHQGNLATQVGECGLDKRFDGYEDGGIQEQVFTRQVQMAIRYNRALQIHCVGDYHRILKAIPLSDPQKCPINFQVIFHRFGGDVSVVKSALKLLGSRAIFSLHADSFRKKSTITAIREIPVNQIRFETDGDDETWTADRIISELRQLQQAADS